MISIIHTNTGIFTPSLAGTGQKILSYSFTDNNFCKNIAYDTTIVHSLPTPSFGGYQNQYCTAAANDALSSLNPPSLGSSFSFWGSIISQPIGVLDPSLDSTGLKTIFMLLPIHWAAQIPLVQISLSIPALK